MKPPTLMVLVLSWGEGEVRGTGGGGGDVGGLDGGRDAHDLELASTNTPPRKETTASHRHGWVGAGLCVALEKLAAHEGIGDRIETAATGESVYLYVCQFSIFF